MTRSLHFESKRDQLWNGANGRGGCDSRDLWWKLKADAKIEEQARARIMISLALIKNNKLLDRRALSILFFVQFPASRKMENASVTTLVGGCWTDGGSRVEFKLNFSLHGAAKKSKVPAMQRRSCRQARLKSKLSETSRKYAKNS